MGVGNTLATSDPETATQKTKAWLQKGAKNVKFDGYVKQHLEKRSSIFAWLEVWDVSRFE